MSNDQSQMSNDKCSLKLGVFQSGQMGQTVNLLSSTSVVRIHPHPQRNREHISHLEMQSLTLQLEKRRAICSVIERLCRESRKY